jgi:large subunit ribosomal protein L30
MSQKFLNVTLVRSKFGRLKTHQECLKGLGLKRMHQTVRIADTPCNLGMINKVSYMLRIEDA